MDIPIKCFTCGNMIADKYGYYCEEIVRRRRDRVGGKAASVQYLTNTPPSEKTPEEQVMDELGLKLYCCRRMMLTHVEVD
jgi:DNA-directed RNA polymerase subunit N